MKNLNNPSSYAVTLDLLCAFRKDETLNSKVVCQFENIML